MTTVTEFEPFVDQTIHTLVAQLDERFDAPGLPCNIATWLQYCKCHGHSTYPR